MLSFQKYFLDFLNDIYDFIFSINNSKADDTLFKI